MKDPTFAPSYCCLYPKLAAIARSHGYALAVHGSLQRDFDLVAVPWTETALDARTLYEAIANECSHDGPSESAKFVDGQWVSVDLREPELKLHGRLCWTIILHHTAFIDLSVMPRVSQ